MVKKNITFDIMCIINELLKLIKWFFKILNAKFFENFDENALRGLIVFGLSEAPKRNSNYDGMYHNSQLQNLQCYKAQ